MEALKNMLFTMQSITDVDSLLAETHDQKMKKSASSQDAMVQVM